MSKCPHANALMCKNAYCGMFGCMKDLEERREILAAQVLNRAFNKWSDGGGTGLVEWTGDLGPGLQVDHTKVAE